MNTITFKSNKKNYNFLSNFYPYTKYNNLPFNSFIIHNLKFNSVEHYYQYIKIRYIAKKYVEFSDILYIYAKNIINTKNALDVKKMSSKIALSNFLYSNIKIKITKKNILEKLSHIIIDWNYTYSVKFMKIGLEAKFNINVNPELCLELISTGNKKLGESGGRSKNKWDINGKNILGRLLMEIRENLKEVHDDNKK